MTTMPVTTVSEAIRVFRPNEPLKPGDPRYQDFSSIRGMALNERIGRLLESYSPNDEYVHVALSGHRGSGKSTELLW